MRLVIDVGNTSINYALFKKGQLKKTASIRTVNHPKFKIKQKNITSIIYASVVPAVDGFFRNYFKTANFKELNFKDIPPLKIGLRNKKEIGIDRLVNSVGTILLYQTPAIIVDLGSATTFCIVDQNNTYRGGLICPGIKLSAEALFKNTAKLPLVEIKKPAKEIIGNNTLSAMQAGLFFGYQAMIEGVLLKLRKKLKIKYKIIATGGYAKLISKKLNPSFDIIDKNLTLKSLNLIGDLLAKKKEASS